MYSKQPNFFQWNAAANSPNGTYAEQAKKNMVPLRGQTINGRYDQQPQAWGGLKVDQVCVYLISYFFKNRSLILFLFS